MKEAFRSIVGELALWRQEGRALPLWWRDDDAVEPTPALDRLLELAAGVDAPLHIAAIPEPAAPALAERLSEAPETWVLPHGWRHFNHAPASEKKAEFRSHRPLPAMLGEIAEGWQRIQALFGLKALPVFTPPWNRVAPEVVEKLPEIGLAVLSTFTPRRRKNPTPSMLEVNTHLDPVDWRRHALLDPAAIAAQAVALLADRRLGRADNAEPFGLLTHHLVHDEAIWTATATLLEIFAGSGVARWVSPMEELSPTPA